MKPNRIAVAAATVFLAAVATAQSELAGTEKQKVIDALLSAMRRDYVFPDLAKRAEIEVRRHLANGDYDAINDGPAFAQRLTDDLKAVCHDAHLGLSFSPRPLPVRARADRPSREEAAMRQLFERKFNGGFTRVERLDGNVGYIRIDGFATAAAAEGPIRAAMEFVARTDALIFDVRENGGGEPEAVQLVCSYLFGNTPVHLNDIYTRPTNQTKQFWTLRNLKGPRYLDRPVYVLVSKRSASAAEELAYNLKNLRRATIVGETTWGGANPGNDIRLTDHFSAYVPNGRAINPITKTNWEGTGVTPDVPATDALTTAHILALRSLISREKEPNLARILRETLIQVEGRPSP